MQNTLFETMRELRLQQQNLQQQYLHLVTCYFNELPSPAATASAEHVVADRDSMAVLPPAANAHQRLVDLCYDRGLIVYSRRTRGGVEGDHILVCPPLIVTEAQIDEIMVMLTDALAELAPELGF